MDDPTQVPLIQPKFSVVCECGEPNSQTATIEINFRDTAIYYVCPVCKRVNKMILKPMVAKPLPRARLSR